MKIFLIIFATIVSLFLLIEGGLRLIFSLHNPLIYLPDQEIGYLLAPNQQVRRLGKQLKINQYSMRSDNFEEKPPTDTLRILLLGDSIANGAWWTDQKQTISALIENQIGNQTQVLNASANSWGPRNQLAYLQRFGIFKSQLVILLLNTDDLFATAPTSLPVGNHPNYPASKPPLALTKLITRIFFPPQPLQLPKEEGDLIKFNLEAIKAIKTFLTKEKAHIILAITPKLSELNQQQRDYEKRGRERLKELTVSEKIPYIDFLPIFQKTAQPELLYRDHIHPSPLGNRLVSETLSQSVKELSHSLITKEP